MQPTLCARCKKNMAVIFITRIENNESRNEGLCLKCARELHIKPVDDMINNVLDWFGNDVKMERTDEGNIRFSVYASPRAMRFWILQFGRYVKVIGPQSLCDIIKVDIAEMQKLYEE